MADISGVSGAGEPHKIPEPPLSQEQQLQNLQTALQLFQQLIPALAVIGKK